MMRLHLDETGVQKLEGMASRTGLSAAVIAGQLIAAGLRALPDDKLILPLEFQLKPEHRTKAHAA